MKPAIAVTVEHRTLNLTNINKVLFPISGMTKGELINYYRRIADTLVPHIAHRPLTLKMYPDGIEEPYFYMKEAPRFRPEWLATEKVLRDVPKRGKPDIDYILVNDRASLMWVANMASIEIHIFLARAEAVRTPSFVAFDLDPGPDQTLLDCAWAALELKKVLSSLNLSCFVKTSGKKGLHVYVPLNRNANIDETKSFARAIAGVMEHRFPRRLTANMRKDLRPGKVYVDWAQNDAHKTTVAVYSMRAVDPPAVSAPLSWDELESALRRKTLRGLIISPEQIFERLDKWGDLFAPVLTLKQKLPKLTV